MKTYKETKAAVRELVKKYGLRGVTGRHIIALKEQGHTEKNIQNALSYFEFSPQTENYR